LLISTFRITVEARNQLKKLIAEVSKVRSMWAAGSGSLLYLVDQVEVAAREKRSHHLEAISKAKASQ
jgi:hypothetical protein